MLFQESSQDVVQQFAGVERGQIERGFAARLEPQHPVGEKSIRTVAVDTQPAGAVHVIASEVAREHGAQVRVGNLAIKRPKPGAVSGALDINSPRGGRRENSLRPCLRMQLFYFLSQ